MSGKGYDEVNGKRVIYTRHAKERMFKREIEKRRVVMTLREADIRLPVFPDNTQELRKQVGKKTHFVVVEHQKDIMKVITTGWSNE